MKSEGIQRNQVRCREEQLISVIRSIQHFLYLVEGHMAPCAFVWFLLSCCADFREEPDAGTLCCLLHVS